MARRGGMIDRGKRSILGIGVNVIDYQAAVEKIIDAARLRRSCSVSALAVHGVMTGAADPEQKYRLNRLDIVTPDGQPVRWALLLLHGERLNDRVDGPTLTAKICERAAAHGMSIFLFGSRAEVLQLLGRNLLKRWPALKIAGMQPSMFRRGTAAENQVIDAKIIAADADIVFVGLGCPRQEAFVYEHAAALCRPVIAVGAAFDFHAGLLKRAPRWMQQWGLEWLFRLAAEPMRLWRRYLLLNPLYCLMIAAQYFGVLNTLKNLERRPSDPAGWV